MKHLLVFVFVLTCCFCAYAAPVDEKDANKDAKSAFGQAFDEIVVESHLTVRRKPNGRQARNQNTTTAAPVIIKTKREIKQINRREPQLSASAADSQSQAFNSFGPLGGFGASASGTQTQGFQIGPNGFLGSAAFSGTQQYTINGKTVDVSFGSGLANNGGSVVTITDSKGKKRPMRP